MAGPEASWADGMRWAALTDACHNFGCGSTGSDRAQSRRCKLASTTTAEVLAQRPTAVIAYNDLMAIGLIKGMRVGGHPCARRRQRHRVRQRRALRSSRTRADHGRLPTAGYGNRRRQLPHRHGAWGDTDTRAGRAPRQAARPGFDRSAHAQEAVSLYWTTRVSELSCNPAGDHSDLIVTVDHGQPSHRVGAHGA